MVNGWFTLSVPSSGACAVIKRIARHSGAGKPVQMEDILKKLKKENVIHGIDMTAIHELLTAVEKNEIPDKETVIARSDVENGENGTLTWHIEGLTENPAGVYVAPDTPIAVRKPASKGKPGKNIFGKRLNPRPGFDPPLEIGEGIVAAGNKSGEITYTAKHSGWLRIMDKVLKVASDLTIAADKMQAQMDIHGVGIDGRKITLADVQANITSAGITTGVINENITRALTQSCNSGQTVKDVLIAMGKPPVHGHDAVIEWLMQFQGTSDLARAVVPGQLLATHTAEVQPEAGINLFGTALPVKPVHAKTINSGAGVTASTARNKTEYRARWLGVASFAEGMLMVNPDVEISADKMSVHMGLFTHTASRENNEITCEQVLRTLADHGVKSGIKANSITASLAKARADDRHHFRMLVAEGTPAQHGVNARLIIDNKVATGRLLPDGNIDYHERSYPWNVNENDVIGHVKPAIPGKNGGTVTGEPITATPAENLKLQLTGVSQDRGGKLKAASKGILLINGLNIKVTDNLVIEGDIDHKTGNIHTDTSVVINGYVKPGYTVQSKEGDVVIQENIEDGQIYAHGSVVIKTGIRGAKSVIAAGGSIRTTFVENARLMAAGDVVVSTNMVTCHTWCKGNMTVGDAGSAHSTLVGGASRVGKTLTVANLGSEGCMKTDILLGPQAGVIARYRKFSEEMARKKQEINELETIFKHYQQEPGGNQKKILVKIAKTSQARINEYEKIETGYNVLHDMITRARQAKVVIRKQVFPGVRVHLLGQVYEVNDKRGPGTIHLSGEQLIFEAG